MPILGIDNLAALGSAFQSVLISGIVPFDLKNLKDQDFPYAEYSENVSRYKEAVSWFTGDALEPPNDTDKKSEPYPIRINPINGTVLKNGYALFCEFSNDSRPLVIPRMVLD